MNEKELIDFCLRVKGSTLDYPFSNKKYKNTPVLRVKNNNKWFGLIFVLEDELCLNLKAKPFDISLLKEQYTNSIKPAWHMNKSHWYRVEVNKIEKDILMNLIKNSFDIVKGKNS